MQKAVSGKTKGALALIVAGLAALIIWQGWSKPIPRVDAPHYNAYWLWAGVKPQAVLETAKTIYILDSEVNDGPPVTLVNQRAGIPRLPNQTIWMVVRVQSLDWPQGLDDHLIARLATWKANGNNQLAGLQIDFDAGTKGLKGYAAFLQKLRAKMPPDMKLSVTGLLDWSANGDPEGLNALGGVVDEVVLQTYQGRHTIPGYEAYLAKLDRLNMPFKIGLVQNGVWREPPTLKRHPQFKGYVVFLLNP